MNFNLISPDGEGQKFNVKFQEPIVIPPNAKIGLNFSQFERNGHFDFIDDQEFTIEVANRESGNDPSLDYNVIPRLPMVSTDATAVFTGRPLNSKFPNSNIPANSDLNSIRVIVPAGTYSFDALNIKINELIYEQGIGIFKPFYDDQFFGRNKIPTIKQNAVCSLLNTQALTQGVLKNTMVLGWEYSTALHAKVIQFSTQHLKNATNVEESAPTPSSYKPSQNSVGGEYESYAMGRHRVLHFDTIGSNEEIEGKEINIGQVSHICGNLRQELGAVPFLGKNFIGCYSLDYAGLTDETHSSFNSGTAGGNFNKDVHTTRTGTDGTAALSPDNTAVINSDTLLNSTTNGAGDEVPKVFFGVEIRDNFGGFDEEIRVYASKTMRKDFRDKVIDDMELIFQHDISTLQGIPHNLTSGQVQIGIHFVEETRESNGSVDNVDYDIGNEDVVFPLITISKGGVNKYIAFDGRKHTFPRTNQRVAFTEHFFTANRIPDELTDSIATRGSDLPFAPFFAGSHTDNGFVNVHSLRYEPQVGTQNSATDPLRPLHFLRTHSYDIEKNLAQDLFELAHKNERGQIVVQIPRFSPINMDRKKLLEQQTNPISDFRAALVVSSVPHNYRNDAFNIHINLPIKSFSNINEKNRSGIRKNILAHCPQVFGSNITDDQNVVNGRKIITGGFAPSIGVVNHLDNMGIITTNNFEIEVRNMNDDTPANQLFKSIVNFSIFP
tara:strand:- start:3865 stop:6030 length:2166 start_codon:yes stop_codon:yes gene_type:complete